MKIEEIDLDIMTLYAWHGFHNKQWLAECMAISVSEDEELFHAQ